MNDNMTLVIGLDGATWRLLDQWIEQGELPALKSIKDTSAVGTMQPCFPPVTCPNWKCYSTGKNPGKLGVFWWEIIDVEKPEITVPDSTSFDSPELWDYLSADGYNVGVINMPLAFPPNKVNGFLIARHAANDQAYTNPEPLKRTLKREFDYKVNPESSPDEDGYVDEVHELIESRFDVLKWTLETKDTDFVHTTVFLINALQHHFWDSEPTLQGWKIIDEKLGEIVDDDHNIIFMSDHGSNEIETTFQANSWLEAEGYLTRQESAKETVDSLGYQIGLTQRSLSKMTNKLGVRRYLRKIVPDSVINSLPSEGVSKRKKLNALDWEQTDAVASGQGLIYIIKKDSEEYDKIRDEIISKLESLTLPHSDKPVAEKVYKKEDIYHGNYLFRAPDIVFDQSPGVHTDELVGERDTFESPKGWKGENERDGIFMAHGPAFSQKDVGDVAITDVMPTIFHLMGEPIPSDVDGSVLDVFTPELELSTRAVTYRDPISKPAPSDLKSKDAEERLRELGYLN
jgi:predicted AlkP superfamily phosphohydrolase/phosphomutase